MAGFGEKQWLEEFAEGEDEFAVAVVAYGGG